MFQIVFQEFQNLSHYRASCEKYDGAKFILCYESIKNVKMNFMIILSKITEMI